MPPTVEINIGGQIAIVPGVYASASVNPQIPSGLVPTGPLVFIAAGFGGVPFQATNYTDGTSLQTAMRGAPSADLVPFMFNPSSELNGTSLVTYINVNPNTQSSATMVSSGNTGVITLTSTDYGTPSNLIQYAVGSASYTPASGVAVTLTDGFSGASVTGDNLGTPFQVAYLGGHNGVLMTISSTISGKATQLQITSAGVGESVTLDLTSQTFSTVQSVVEFLDGTGFYTCYVVNNGSLPSTSLDLVTNVALPKPIASVDQYVNVTATLGDIVYWFNTVAASIATAAISVAITSNPGNQPALTASQFFAGATNGVASLANYASGLNVALTVPAWVVLADTNSAGVQALGAQHAASASTVIQQKWRRFLTGSALNETPATAETNAHNLNEFMVTYCWPGIQRTNLLTGANQTYDGLHVAAAVAGMMTGNAVPIPVTNKTLIGNGIEQVVQNATKIALQDSGVLVLDYPTNTKIPTFLSDVTTWQNSSNAAYVFNQQVACQFALLYYITNQLSPYVGTIASNFSEAIIRSATVTALNTLIYNGQNAAGILNSWDPNSLALTFDGSTQAVTIRVGVVLVGQNRFIIVGLTINPLNITISAQGVVTNG